MSKSTKKITVLHIAGTGRNGSTLMERVLNEFPGFFAAGELGWGDLFKNHKACFCGELFTCCPVWQKILQQEELKTVDTSTMLELTYKYKRWPNFFKSQFLRKFQKTPVAEFEQYLQTLQNLYQAIHSHIGCQIITDSTASTPLYGYYLSLIPTIDLYVIHLVRDPRGFVHSCNQPKFNRRGELWSKGQNFFFSACQWLKKNIIIEIVFARNHGDKYIRIHYEDLVKNPEEVLEQIGNLVGLKLVTDKLTNQRISIGINHLTRGNIDAVNRSSEQQLVLKLDNRWKHSMKRWKIFLVTLITWPLLLKYSLRKKVGKVILHQSNSFSPR